MLMKGRGEEVSQDGVDFDFVVIGGPSEAIATSIGCRFLSVI